MILSLDSLISKYGLRINGVIHIGGHHGEEVDSYQKNHIDNGIFFEPDPECIKIIQKRINNTKYILHECALGSKEGIISIYRSSNEGMSNSVLKPSKHITIYPSITFNEKFECKINKLDDFDTKDYNFLNMDTQGYELEVLKGAIKTLAHVDYIMSEVNTEQLYEDSCLIGQLEKFLLQYKFNRKELRLDGGNWGDAFYIKENR